MLIERQQLEEWWVLADAATPPATTTITGGMSMGFDIDIPRGIRNSFAYRPDAEFCSQARGAVLALLDEVVEQQQEIARLRQELDRMARNAAYKDRTPYERRLLSTAREYRRTQHSDAFVGARIALMLAARVPEHILF